MPTAGQRDPRDGNRAVAPRDHPERERLTPARNRCSPPLSPAATPRARHGGIGPAEQAALVLIRVLNAFRGLFTCFAIRIRALRVA
jgi:hypothetical protein